MKNITTLFFTLLFSFSILANVAPSERNALVKLYEKTNGSQWVTKWDLSKPVSTWYGVKLQDEKVVSLNLANNNLVGEIPYDIAELVSLQELDLHKNHLSGEIPSIVGNLKELKILDISFNSLTGTIPVSVCEMNKLQELALYMNGLSGELPEHGHEH